MKCDYHKTCPNEAAFQFFLAKLDDERNRTDPIYYCNDHATVVRKTHIVNKEVKLPDENSEFMVGSSAKETGQFEDTLQDLKDTTSQE